MPEQNLQSLDKACGVVLSPNYPKQQPAHHSPPNSARKQPDEAMADGTIRFLPMALNEQRATIVEKYKEPWGMRKK